MNAASLRRRQQVGDDGAALRVANGRNVTARFVDEIIFHLALQQLRVDQLAFDFDGVRLRISAGAKLGDNAAINGDLAALHHLFRRAA